LPKSLSAKVNYEPKLMQLLPTSKAHPNEPHR
jgi:hypothetical protein